MSSPSLPSAGPLRSAEIVAVGTELLLGEVIDTNGSWLAARMAERGVDVYWSQRVGDNLARVRHALEQALARSELVLVCGGLGPTEDDLTREAIAAILGETPEVDAGLERDLRAYFERLGRPMPASNLKQAWLVPSAVALPNPLGTAPGWLVTTEWRGTPRTLAALPGPPRELEPMFLQEVLPRLELPTERLHVRTFKSFDLGESAIAERLAAWTSSPNPSVATYARRDGVHVRVAAKAADRETAARLAAPAEADVRDALADRLWGVDDDELPAAALAALRARGWGLAVLELASGGAVAEALGAVPEAPETLRGSVVAWSHTAMSTIGDPSLFEAALRSEPRAAAAAAEAVRRAYGAEVGVAVCGSPRADDEDVVTVALASPLGEPRLDELRIPRRGQAWRTERILSRTLVRLLTALR